jgi:WD40 repeat protein/serine/threonine protein kinase
VAIKIILPEFANRPDFIRRFETEAQLVAQLEHLHIVPLYDYWRDPEGAYLVMRLMKGGSLEDQIRENGPLELAASVKLVDQIASALNAAHQQGVVHRDLKPANILLDEDGNAYLSDFGIAKAIGDQAGLTATGAILGTPAYITPEQVQSREITPQTDIYALGVVLYELLVGGHPFPNTPTGALMLKHVNEPLPLIRDSHTQLPSEVDQVIQKATSKDPANRYPDVLTLAREFHQALRLVVAVPEEFEAELVNPYKGLRAFQEADSDDFFGRLDLTEELINQLQEGQELSRFLAVVGPSGSGKSSVVKAGLLPALRRGAVPGSDQWYFIDMIPKAHPIEELDINLTRISANPNVIIGEQLTRDARGLLRATRLALPTEEGELLLIVDQFEEVYTQVEDPDEARQFMSLIYQAVTDPHSQVRVIITLRADFYDRPLMFPEFSSLVKKRTAVIVPMTSEELALAIRCPAERVGAVLEEGLVTTIVADVLEQPGALPLLQYALTELFEGHEGRLLTNQAYQSIGGVLGALGRRAEEVYSGLDKAGKDAARQLFLRLVTLGEGVEDTRRRVLRSEVEALPVESPSAESPQVMGQVIETFGKARLLSFDHDPITRGPTVEVAHEALLKEWRRLKEWLEDSRADIRLERILSNAVVEWERGDKDPSFLLSGSRLAQFEGWAEHTSIALTEGELLFLQASLLHEAERKAHQAALERRSRNFLRGLVGVFALATVVAVVLSVFALNARNQARSEADARATQQAIAESEADRRATQQAIAEQEASARATAEAIAVEQREQVLRQASIRLADDAQSQIELGHPERAVLLMLAGLETYPYTPQAENALARSVVEISTSRLSPDPGRHGWSAVAWSPTDNRVATAIWAKSAGSDSYILIQDPQTNTDLLRITGEECLGPSNVTWSPSGDRLIMVPQYCDYIPVVWDSQSGELLASLASQPDQAAFSASWSPDGQAILTGSQDGIARIWDSQTGVKRGEILAHNDYITQVDWSPSGEYLATASMDNTAKIWDAATYELQYELSGFSDDVSGLAWSPDSEKIITVSLDPSAQVWDADTGESILILIGHEDKIWDVAWSPDGRYIATDSRDGTARIWDANTGKELFRFRNARSEEAVLNTIDWSPDGDQVLVMGGVLNQIWDLSAQPPWLLGHLEGLQAAAWSPDGEQIASASLDGTARIWDAASGEMLNSLVHPAGVEDLVWSPGGEQLATADQEGNVRIWEVDSKSYTEMSNPDNIRFDSLGWSPDGDRIVASSQWDLVSVIWEVKTGEIIELEQGDLECYLASPSWSPGGDRFVTGCVKREVKDTPARIWNAETGQELERLEGEDGNSLVVDWSPDGSSIAVAYSEMSIRIWDLETTQPGTRYTGHADIIADMHWSPNSQRLVSADGGGFIKVWESATGDEILSFKMTTSINCVHWSPDGQYVIAASINPEPGIYRAWQSTQELIDYAEGCCVWRELTVGERQQFGLPLQ